jgi:hypothetical protein
MLLDMSIRVILLEINVHMNKNHAPLQCNRHHLTSGVAATRFSSGNLSFGTPTVNLLYGIPFGLTSSSFLLEKDRVAREDEVEVSLDRERHGREVRRPDLVTVDAVLREARRIMMDVYRRFANDTAGAMNSLRRIYHQQQTIQGPCSSRRQRDVLCFGRW